MSIFTEPDKIDKALARNESDRDALIEELVYGLAQAWACIEHIKEHAPSYEKNASIEVLKDIHVLITKAEREGYGQGPGAA